MKRLFLILTILFYTLPLWGADFAVITVANGDTYKELVKSGTESKRAYCKKHGYDFILCEDNLDPSRHIYWSKVLLTLRTLDNPSYKWVVWLDADTIIMNQGIRLEELVDERYNFIISQDLNGINSGIYFIKNCEWSKQFFKGVYARTDCIPLWLPEQTAISLEMSEKSEIRSRCKVVPQRLFNSYAKEVLNGSLTDNYQPGDFLLHFASARGQVLASLFDKYSKEVIDNPDLPTLNQYLGFYGIHSSSKDLPEKEQSLHEEQKKQFQKWEDDNPDLTMILGIGLNRGHWVDFLLQTCMKVEKLTIHNQNQFPYTIPTTEYLSRRYKNKFEHIQGVFSKVLKLNPKQKFDLIYIDEEHKASIEEIKNYRKLAHADTVLFFYNYSLNKECIDKLLSEGKITIKNIFRFPRFEREWVEARYNF